MNFGEKLFTLRKKEGLSQEALAEKLNTSRQAISKWENGQGFPETEKILKIGNIFNVSMDYLLKDSVEEEKKEEVGYYVSREMADGFLLNEEKLIKNITLGLMMFALAYIGYLIFKDRLQLCILFIGIIGAIGMGLIFKGAMLEDNYKKIKQQQLVFDDDTLKSLRERYEDLKKKSFIQIFGLSILIVGMIILLITGKILELEGINYKILATFCIAIGGYIFVNCAVKIEAYEILVENDKYINNLSNKIMRKAKKNLNKILE